MRSYSPLKPGELQRQAENWQRRRFLKQAMIALGAAGGLARNASLLAMIQSLAPEFGVNRAFAAAPGQRRHLINLIGWGGWEGTWWHNSLARGPFSALSATNPGVFVSSALTSFENDKYNTATQAKLTQWFGDSEGLQVDASPHHYLGKGMRYLFNDMSPDVGLGDIAILKGLMQTGQHGIGNTALNQGGLSSYAKSFSSLISAYLAQNDYPRIMHYVTNADSPGSLFLNTANTSGYEVPVCISSLAAFRSFTQTASVLGFPAFRPKSEARLDRAMSALAGFLTGRATQASSKNVSSGFTASQSAANLVSHSGWADSVEFQSIYVRYMNAIVQGLGALASPVYGGAYSTSVSGFASVMQGLFTPQFQQKSDQLLALTAQYPSLLTGAATGAAVPQSAVDQAAQLRAALQTAIDSARGLAAPNLNTVEATGMAQAATHDESIGSLAFSFAMAEFLVRFDLSAVVDVGISVQDVHYDWPCGLANVTGSMACFRELIRALKSTGLPDGSSLLSHTAIVMTTELDRNPYLEANGQHGTNHGLTASVLMAGYKTRGGAILGGVSRGPLEDPSFQSGGKPIAFGAALPVNSAGQPDPNGSFNNVESVFPTMLTMFGITVPLQQITEYGAIAAALKG